MDDAYFWAVFAIGAMASLVWGLPLLIVGVLAFLERSEEDRRIKDRARRVREKFPILSGHQWSPEDMARMQNQDRLPLVINRVPACIHAPDGLIAGNGVGVEISECQRCGNPIRRVGRAWVTDAFRGPRK